MSTLQPGSASTFDKKDATKSINMTSSSTGNKEVTALEAAKKYYTGAALRKETAEKIITSAEKTRASAEKSLAASLKALAFAKKATEKAQAAFCLAITEKDNASKELIEATREEEEARLYMENAEASTRSDCTVDTMDTDSVSMECEDESPIKSFSDHSVRVSSVEATEEAQEAFCLAITEKDNARMESIDDSREEEETKPYMEKVVDSLDTNMTSVVSGDGSPLKSFSGHSDCVSPIKAAEEAQDAFSQAITEQDNARKELIDATGDEEQVISYKEKAEVSTCSVFTVDTVDTDIISMESGDANLINTFNGHSDCVSSVETIGPDGFLSASSDCSIKLWRLSSGECVQTFHGHSSEVYSVASVNNSQFLSGSWDKTIKLWSVSSETCLCTFEGHSGGVISITDLVHCNRFVSASSDTTLRSWNVSTGECTNVHEGHSDEVITVVSLGNGSFLSGSRDTTLKLWSTEISECKHTFEGHSDSVTSIAVLGRNEFLSASTDQRIILWNLATGQCLRTFKGNVEEVWSLAKIGNGMFLAGYSDNTIKLWDALSAKCIRTFKGHSDAVVSLVARSHHKQFISAADDGTAKLWKLGPNQCRPVCR